MKSAIEIAMERTKDIKAADDPYALTPEEKEQVRELNKKYDVKIAELETQFNSRIRSLRETHGTAEVEAHMEQFYVELRNQREVVNAERAEKMAELMKSLGK